ncbi:hypothetical protein BX666DRAFT_1130331 [Dichotomocladium elegans]|nr:hypothetical protein BX666DRAFT_1130331 [Dichotomocladium elegans]
MGYRYTAFLAGSSGANTAGASGGRRGTNASSKKVCICLCVTTACSFFREELRALFLPFSHCSYFMTKLKKGGKTKATTKTAAEGAGDATKKRVRSSKETSTVSTTTSLTPRKPKAMVPSGDESLAPAAKRARSGDANLENAREQQMQTKQSKISTSLPTPDEAIGSAPVAAMARSKIVKRRDKAPGASVKPTHLRPISPKPPLTATGVVNPLPPATAQPKNVSKVIKRKPVAKPMPLTSK